MHSDGASFAMAHTAGLFPPVAAVSLFPRLLLRPRPSFEWTGGFRPLNLFAWDQPQACMDLFAAHLSLPEPLAHRVHGQPQLGGGLAYCNQRSFLRHTLSLIIAEGSNVMTIHRQFQCRARSV